VALAGAVRPEHRHPLAEVHVEVERKREVGELEALDHQRSTTRPSAPQLHPDRLLAHPLWGRTSLVELAQSRLGRLGSWGEDLGEAGPPLHLPHDPFEPGPLLDVEPVVPLDALEARCSGVGVGEEPAAVGPRPRGLDGDHLGGGGGQELAIVADVEHRLRRGQEL